MNLREPYITNAEYAQLKRKSWGWGGWYLLSAWGMIGGSMAVYALWPNPFSFVLAVLVIGGRQLGLAILMHECAHGTLLPNPRLGDWCGRWLCAYPIGTDLDAYRRYHFHHHRRTGLADDPDLGLAAPFPVSKASLARKFARDLLGITFLKLRLGQVMMAWRKTPGAQVKGADVVALGSGLYPMLVANALLFAVLWALGRGEYYLWFWLLPLATWFQLVLRVRNIAEHAMVGAPDDPLANARTTRAGWLARLSCAPYRVNYHLEHHMNMTIPGYHLPAMHRLLLERGYRPQMMTATGYIPVLRLASSA